MKGYDGLGLYNKVTGKWFCRAEDHSILGKKDRSEDKLYIWDEEEKTSFRNILKVGSVFAFFHVEATGIVVVPLLGDEPFFSDAFDYTMDHYDEFLQARTLKES